MARGPIMTPPAQVCMLISAAAAAASDVAADDDDVDDDDFSSQCHHHHHLIRPHTKITRSKQAQACNTAPCLRISDIFT